MSAKHTPYCLIRHCFRISRLEVNLETQPTMTLRSRKADGSEYIEDDVISYCGIVSGHSLASRKSGNGCSLRKHQINVIAQKLKNLPVDDNIKDANNGFKKEGLQRKRLNGCFHNYRFLIACMGGFAVGFVFLLRYSITVAIIQMVNQTAIYMDEHPNRTVEDFLDEGYTLGGEFEWSNEIQQMIMSWYMFAYTLPQLPCTRIALKYGHRKAIPILLAICAISSLLTPPLAYVSWKWVLGLRLIQGVGAAAIMPMQLGLIENWMPYNEMSIGVTCITLIPSSFLPIIPMFIGYLCDIHWSYTFYVPATITIVFCFMWFILVTDRPDENWLVSETELDRICSCQNAEKNQEENNHKTMKSGQQEDISKNSQVKKELTEIQYQAKWFDPFKIPSFYAFLILWVFHCSSINNFLFLLPAYLRQFLKIGISLNGTYCSIIQIGSIFAILWPHLFLRALQTKFDLSLTASRRIAYAIVVCMVGGSWLLIGLFHQHQLILLAINRCFHSTTDFLVTGTIMSNYAKEGLSSTAYSLINCVGNLTVVATSTFIGYLLDQTGSSVETWSWLFISGSITQFIMLIIYSTMISSNPVTIKRKSAWNEKNAV